MEQSSAGIVKSFILRIIGFILLVAPLRVRRRGQSRQLKTRCMLKAGTKILSMKLLMICGLGSGDVRSGSIVNCLWTQQCFLSPSGEKRRKDRENAPCFEIFISLAKPSVFLCTNASSYCKHGKALSWSKVSFVPASSSVSKDDAPQSWWEIVYGKNCSEIFSGYSLCSVILSFNDGS